MGNTAEGKGSIFSLLSSIFKKRRIHCVLVGGYALNAYKVQRMTFDIDFILTAEDYSKIEQDLVKVGYSILYRQEAFVQLKGEKPGLRDLDFLIADAGTLNDLIEQALEISIAGEPFFVPSPLHLIAMKLHSIGNAPEREFKDLQDIIQLMRVTGISPLDQGIQDLFGKYQAGQFLKKVIQSLGA